jgi:hypothetical protein
MFDFSNLVQARDKIQNRDEQRASDYLACYEEALAEFADFTSLEHEEQQIALRNAAEALAEAMEYQRQHAEPYLLLGAIFFVLNQSRMALRYLQVARSLQPQLPGLLDLFVLVSDSIPKGEQTTLYLQVPYKSPEPNYNLKIRSV